MKVARVITLALLTLLLGYCAQGIHTSVQRSRQKRTMADMHNIAARIEKGQRIDRANDAWGHPLRIHRSGPHYSIQAAGSDGKFQAIAPYFDGRSVTTTKFSDDVLLRDGLYVQYPDGVCIGDIPGKGPLGKCMSCHPHRIQKR